MYKVLGWIPKHEVGGHLGRGMVSWDGSVGRRYFLCKPKSMDLIPRTHTEVSGENGLIQLCLCSALRTCIMECRLCPDTSYIHVKTNDVVDDDDGDKMKTK